MRTAGAILGIAALCVGSAARAAERKGVQVDAKDVALPEVVRLLTTQGGPKLAVSPDLEAEKVTFAAKGMTAYAALRWLCRTQGMIAAEAKDGRLTLGRPTIAPSVDREYIVAKLTLTQESSDALLGFIKGAIFEMHPIRLRDDQGKEEPVFDAVLEKGKLKVFAPPIVQREVQTLLRAIQKVLPRRGFEDIRLAYEPHEVGFLTTYGSGPPPKLLGEVSLKAANGTPAEAAWALTSAAKLSFYVDPWDKGLNSAKASLEADKRPLSEVADSLGQQLGAERCWYDGACVFVRKERRPLFEPIVARAYNLPAIGGFRRPAFGIFRDLARGQRGAGQDLPFVVERGDDLLLVCGPQDWHSTAEDLLKAPEGFGPPWRGPGRGPGRR